MSLIPLRAMIRKDLQLFFSDRRSVILRFIVPIAVASFFGAIFSGSSSDREPAKIDVARAEEIVNRHPRPPPAPTGSSARSPSALPLPSAARGRGLRTIAMVGYDGGRVASEQLADHVVVTRSEHIPRIQEAQASAYHLLRELVELS